jgi:hypothetical protein
MIKKKTSPQRSNSNAKQLKKKKKPHVKDEIVMLEAYCMFLQKPIWP